MNQNMDDKKTIRAWTYYDWANSAYSLIITSAIFPAYYSAIVPEKVMIGGVTYLRSSLASFSISFSFCLLHFYRLYSLQLLIRGAIKNRLCVFFVT
jgi:UMF1 family MFS transporter